MAADITVDSITNTSGTGIFDKLMESVNSNIESQYLNNRITGTDYANVYLSSIQAVLAQSMQYVLQEQLTEAQIDGIAAENLLKAKQLEIAQQELAIKLYELQTILPAQVAQTQAQTAEVTDSTLRANTELDDKLLSTANDRDIKTRSIVEQELTGTKQRLVLDEDIALKSYENTVLQVDQHNTNVAQQTLLATEEEAKQYEVDNILPEQLTRLQEEIDLLQTQDLGELYKVNNILPAELLSIEKDIDVKERTMIEQETMGVAQRVSMSKEDLIKDQQVIKIQEEIDLLETQDLAALYEKDNILPEQLNKLQEEVDLLQTQDLKEDREVKLLEQKLVGKAQYTPIIA